MKLYLKPRNELYLEMSMKESPPSRQEVIGLTARRRSLIRRALLAKGNEIVLGWGREAILKLL